jgi:hypothetical protein
MGQFGNQPDFGTRAANGNPAGNCESPLENTIPLNGAALYIGTGGDLVCNVVGGNFHSPGKPNTTIFRNIPDGTFFPVIVNNVWVDDADGVSTSCENIIALY